jgi:hypothetical protein
MKMKGAGRFLEGNAFAVEGNTPAVATTALPVEGNPLALAPTVLSVEGAAFPLAPMAFAVAGTPLAGLPSPKGGQAEPAALGARAKPASARADDRHLILVPER